MSTPEVHESIPPGHIEVDTGDGDRLSFSNLPEALEYCSRDRERYYQVSSPLEFGINGRLTGIRGEEMLELTVRDKTGIVPRADGEKPGLTVSTNYDFKNWFVLCLKVFEYDDPVFDRGIFWLSINDSELAKLAFGLRPNHPTSIAEIIKRSSEGQEKAFQILNDAMKGIYPKE